MAYKLTYYKVIGNTRINIYEKDGIQATQEIGAVVQGLNLEIQGQQSDVTAPIVKTSLNMVLCDAPDLEPGKKCGGWDVFYTPDATKWKVEVVTINEDDSADVEWSGFITPDSYMEVLTYRGSVNIIARDNIGHLQDIDFTEEGDAVGMMTVKEILRTAWAKIEQPMVLTFDDYEDLMWLQSEGVKAYDASINVSAFAGKTWYDVVEAVLDSFGLCMRYVGLNEVAVTPLRYLSLAGNVVASSTRRIIPTFEAGAIRELTPACRVIVETADYESAGVSAKPITPNDFMGTEGVYSFLEEGESVPISAPVMPISNQSGEGWSNTPSATLFFNPYAREISSLSQRKRLTNEIRRYMYIAANNADFSRFVTYRRAVRALPCNINISLAEPITLEENKIERTDGVMFTHLIYSLAFVQNGITSYYKGNGAWSSSHNVLSTQNYENPLSIPVAFNKIAGGGTLELNIIAIVYASKSAGVSGVGLYASIQNVEFATSSPALSKNIVKTIYDENNNVIVEKSPVLAPALDEVFLPGFIKNGIYVKTDGLYYPAKTWSWDGNGEQQLAVYKHLQFLTFVSKPNNLISGKVIGVSLSKIRSIWMFEGHEHLLISGRFNFLTNNIDNAVLHEFTRYEDMWGELADTASLPEVVTTEQTTPASSGARSEAGNVNSTTVYIGSQGGGGGSSTLAGLDDVNISDILPSSLLVYNGTKWVDATIDTILAPYTLKTDHNALAARVKTNEGAISGINTTLASLDTRVGTNYTAITSLANKVNPIDTWYNEVGKYFKKDSEGVWYVDGNFYTKGQNAAGGIGEADGGGSGIILDYDSIVDALGYAPLQSSDLAPYLKSATAEATYVTINTVDELTNRVTLLESKTTAVAFSQTLTSGKQIGVFTIDNVSKVLYAPSTYAWSEITSRPSKLSDFTDDVVAGKYLPLSGGTLTGGLTISSGNLIVSSGGGDTVTNKLYPTADNTHSLGQNGRRWSDIKTVLINGGTPIHSGNIASQSVASADKLGGYSITQVLPQILQTYRYIGAGTDLDTLIEENAGWWNSRDNTDYTNGPKQNFGLLSARINSAYFGQLAFGYGSSELMYRSQSYGSSGKFWQSWKTIAFTDSNVASATRARYIETQAYDGSKWYADKYRLYAKWVNANILGLEVEGGYPIRVNQATKLATARTLWGQSFDGTGDVDGNISTSGEVFLNHNKAIRMKGSNGTDYNVLFTSGTDLNIGYDSPVIRFGGSKMFINSSGNVGIGTTDPKAKLHVEGELRTYGDVFFFDSSGKSRITFTHASDIARIYNAGNSATMYIGEYSGNALNIVSYNVGIGTTNPQYKLDVAGSIRTTSSLTIGTIVLTDENGTLKIAGNAYTTGQLATGEAGHAASGGGSVQYWSNEYDMDIGTDVLVPNTAYIGTNTIVGWDSAGTCISDLYVGYDGYTIWMQGSVDEASDMRLKTVIDAVNLDIRDIAYAPIFNYVFKSRPQGRQMLGSSAQYWQAIAPKAVSENDKGNLAMNYGAIALASVVAVAKKTLTHEEEIANLKLEVQDLKQRLARYELN